MDNPAKQSGLKPILIFPAGMPRSLDFLEKCQREGQPVIGSSSLAYDVSKDKYAAWTFLPYITEPDFNDALKLAIVSLGIGGIFSPNPVAWNYLKRELKGINPDVQMVNDSPVNDELSGYRVASARAKKVIDSPLFVASDIASKPLISALEIATIFRHGNVISGMCDDEKISALCEIARFSVAGDVVEIGSWWGKSAFVLARLAHCYQIGKTLCVDPWSSAHLVQNDEGGLVDSGIAQYDCDEALRVFEMNLLPYNANNINYLRMPSTEGATHYVKTKNATTESFGSTDYAGQIAILHIDGNHSYEAAKADVDAWTGFVVSGGWIVIDDYVWPYGDGPKKAGDEYLLQNYHRISSAFVMGTALFMQVV
ncbi:class I SAM-dependent methyltransferase [Undibacterium sp. RTI2.1]|nr:MULTISPECIES: class I SAM-dependent methyltransferase [unclassified Undibacterium]MDY7537141.1 class I SAM-dependent methyltransferase [Undibacterium sp. 5I1]MEB0029820.1 class I SAM-dependent methyltransferase [Undibacterium sp. RTI2.1]MEB0115105.1 class I SAM-dependent methyltransferase [Undibacterium sp. RTI2.2]MEB0229319.1 class I SAM-dependent methyltransferase [Undibacterium sp. 10I3]MEB0256133.1 class I SAM-dependent methyltransferase [Undibacterium sp. 5I1]